MKHNNFLSRLAHFFANGALPTPPCNSHSFLRVFTDGEPTVDRQSTDSRPTVEYAVQHTLRYAFLLLTFLLLTPSNMWGEDCTFVKGKTIYMYINGQDWPDRPTGIILYKSNGKIRKADGSEGNPWTMQDQDVSGWYHTMTKSGNYYSYTFQNDDIVGVGFVCASESRWCWREIKKMDVTGAASNKNCVKLTGYCQAAWDVYNSGEAITTCSGGDEPTTKTFKGGEVFYMDQNMIAKNDGQKHDFLKYGRCDFNIYNPDNHDEFWGGLTGTLIPNTTIIKFVVTSDFAGKKWGWVKVKQLEGTTGHNETAKVAIPTDGKNYIKADGSTSTTLNWGTYTEPTPYTGDLWLVGGACIGQSWNQSGCTKMTNEGGGIYTITTQIKSTTADDGFKFKENNSDWGNQWRPTESQATTTRGSNKVMVLSSNEENVPFQKPNSGADTKWQIVTDGDYTYTITIDLSDKDNGKMSIKKDDTPCTHPQSGAWLYLSGNTDLTGKSWVLNTIKLDWDCDEGVYYHTFTNLSHNIHSKYHFKIQKDNTWVGELNTNAIDNNHSGANLDLLAPVNSNNEIGISLPQDADVTIYTNGSKVWAYADMTTPSAGDKTLYLNCKDFTGWPQHATTLAVWDGVEYRPFTKIPDCANDDLFVATGVHSASSYDFEFYNKSDNSSHKVSLNLGANNACRITDWDNGAAQTVTPNYTVHFYKNGHGNDIADRCVAAGSSTTDPQATATDGWVCKGWYTNDGLTDKFIFGTTTITAEITLYAKWEQVEMVTVTFDAKGGTPVPANQEIEKGSKATKPATDPAKAGYNFTGWDWNFNDAINEDKTINAQYSLKGVESVTLDKATLKLVENGETGTIAISTILPSDVLSTTTTWSSDNTGVATVNNGVVTPVAKGTATITCTVANATASKSAICVVTVKGEDEDCEMVLTPIYNYIIGSTPTGGTGATDKLFDPSKQTEPAKITAVQIRVGSGDNSHFAYVDPNDTHVKHGNVTTDYAWWIKEDAGDLSYATDKKSYYLKNVQTGLYLRVEDGNFGGGNWDWKYLVTTTKTDSNKDRCRWFFKTSSDQRLVNFASKKSDNNSYSTGEHFIHRESGVVSAANTYAVAGSSDGNQSRAVLTTTFYGSKEFDNPNYKQSPIEQDSKSYYRFANGASVTATSNMALRQGDVVTVYCYNPSSATVTGTLTIGTENTTISLTAGQKLDFEYTVTAKGATTAVVASNSEDFCVAGIEIARELPDTPKAPNLAWETDLSGGVTQSVEAGAFTHTASSKSAGEITYSSSVPAVATVNATTGVVTPVAAGTTVITATIEQAGCYAEGTASYTVTLTDLPKPEITFVTVPTEMPQGLANQTIVVTTTGGDNFNLAITEGTGATLNITKKTATSITATLSMGAEATNIVLTASTTRTSELAQNSVTANVAVSACIPEGANIFEFTLTSSAAATGQTADGVIGGTVDQTALGTKGTEDNPAMVDVIKMKYQVDNQSPNRNFAVDLTTNPYIQVQVDGNVDAAYWYLIPAGTETYKPSWTNNTYKLYYIYNKATGKYLTHGETLNNSGNDQWKYYTTITTATNAKTDAYKWFFDTSNKDGGTRVVNRADAGNSLPNSFVLNTCNQHHNICDGVAPKPALICGHTSDANSHTVTYDIPSLTTQAANPDMLKSVEYNNKTYYIISSEGSITLHGDFKAGDTVKVDTYNRQTKEAAIEKYEIQADANSYTYTTTNAYVCVNNIKVWRNQVGEMVNPTLTFAQSEVTLDVQQSETSYTQVATPSVTTVNAITYTTDNEEVATVNTEGNVTLKNASSIKHRTLITVTATMPAVGCYNEATASYTILVMNLTPTALQTLVDDTEAGGTLTLQDDFDNCDVTIRKAIKIDAQGHKIGNLTITTAGDLTLASAMTANNLYISADQAASQHVSGQLKGVDNLNLEGTAYMDLSFAADDAITAGWYAFTVPFKVSSTQGIYNVEEEGATKLVNETQYAIMQYQGDVRAQGKYGWIKTHKMGGMLQPGTLYIIAFGDTDYDKIRFVKASGDLNTNTVAISQFASGESTDAGWNGVGNPTLAYGNATNTGGATHAQFLDHEGNAFIINDQQSISEQTYIVSSAFFIQASENATMTFNIPAENGNLFAPRRAAAEGNSEFMVEISQAGKVHDRIFLSASDEASSTYEIGHDLVKMGAIDGAAKVAQVAINGYGMSLCDAEFMFDANNEALFPLTITAPKAGSYTLDIKRACEGQTITLLQNGLPIVMTDGQVSIDLAKGTTTEYSLVIGRTKTDVVTGNEQLKAKGEGIQKFILHNQLRIRKANKIFNAQGIEL